MPVVLRINGYRFWFYEAGLSEPSHIHVGKANKEAKFWLLPLSCAKAYQFREHELNEIEKIIIEHYDSILEAWYKEQKKYGNR